MPERKFGFTENPDGGMRFPGQRSGAAGLPDHPLCPVDSLVLAGSAAPALEVWEAHEVQGSQPTPTRAGRPCKHASQNRGL